jgi:hypothetical protein
MRCCCPAGHGCNAPGGGEPCALDLCRAAAGRERDAAVALERWSIFQRTCEQQRGESEQRARRRAFERARDQALIALAGSRSGIGQGRPGAWDGIPDGGEGDRGFLVASSAA